jgi:hypothetical protein
MGQPDNAILVPEDGDERQGSHTASDIMDLTEDLRGLKGETV